MDSEIEVEVELEASDMEGLEMDEQADLRQQLDSAMATIIKLREAPNQITETEIRDGLESLQRAIQDWAGAIDKELKGSDKDYRTMFIEAFSSQKEHPEDDDDNEYLRSALKQFGIFDGSDNGQSRVWMVWLGHLNTCIDVVFCRGIWTCLERYIFSREYPVGVSLETGDIFTSIIEAMDTEDGDDDERSRASQWKSETMNAYTRTQKFHDQQQTAKTDILDKLDSLVLTILKNNMTVRNRHFQALESDIFEPALNLHQRMTCSSFNYELATPNVRRGDRRVDSKASSWKLQDMVKWRPIDKEDIGGIFQCLYPSVYRVGKTKKEDVLICEATILAYDQSESPKTTRGLLTAPLMPFHESPRESPQQSPRGSPERHSRGLRKAHTGDDRRGIVTVTTYEGGHSHDRRRHHTAPSPSLTNNAVKPKHRGSFFSFGLRNRGSSVEPDPYTTSRDSAPKSRSQPSSRRPSHSQAVSASTRESDLPSTHAAPPTRRESRHRYRPTNIDEELPDNLEPYSERGTCVEDMAGHKVTVYTPYKDSRAAKGD